MVSPTPGNPSQPIDPELNKINETLAAYTDTKVHKGKVYLRIDPNTDQIMVTTKKDLKSNMKDVARWMNRKSQEILQEQEGNIEQVKALENNFSSVIKVNTSRFSRILDLIFGHSTRDLMEKARNNLTQMITSGKEHQTEIELIVEQPEKRPVSILRTSKKDLSTEGEKAPKKAKKNISFEDNWTRTEDEDEIEKDTRGGKGFKPTIKPTDNSISSLATTKGEITIDKLSKVINALLYPGEQIDTYTKNDIVYPFLKELTEQVEEGDIPPQEAVKKCVKHFIHDSLDDTLKRQLEKVFNKYFLDQFPTPTTDEPT